MVLTEVFETMDRVGRQTTSDMRIVLRNALVLCGPLTDEEMLVDSTTLCAVHLVDEVLCCQHQRFIDG